MNNRPESAAPATGVKEPVATDASELPMLPRAAYSLDLNDGFPTVAYSAQQMYDFARAAQAQEAKPAGEPSAWQLVSEIDDFEAWCDKSGIQKGGERSMSWLGWAERARRANLAAKESSA